MRVGGTTRPAAPVQDRSEDAREWLATQGILKKRGSRRYEPPCGAVHGEDGESGMKLEMAQKGHLRAAFRVGAINKGKGYRQSGEDLKPRTDQVSFQLCCNSDMEWEMKRRHGDQLGAVGAEARDVESYGSGSGCGKESERRFLGCGFNSVGRTNGVLGGERPAKTWTWFVMQTVGDGVVLAFHKDVQLQ